jgi:hypothetical protein
VIGVLLLRDKRIQKRRSKIDNSDTSLRFRRNQLSFPESLPDLQRLRINIDVFPLKPQ